MMCLRRGAGNEPTVTLHYMLPAAIGVCFGKAAIIRPRVPPRDDKHQSNERDTVHVQTFSMQGCFWRHQVQVTDKPKWHSQALLQQLLLQSLVLVRIQGLFALQLLQRRELLNGGTDTALSPFTDL